MNAAAAHREVNPNDAIAYPLDGAFVAIVGAAGTGKTAALVRRAKRAAQLLLPPAQALASAASAFGVHALRRQLGEGAASPRILCAPLGDVAFGILTEHRFELGISPDLALIEDVRAEELFSDAAASLYALEWDEFLSAELDPEITGLRAPQRFAVTAYRLIRKLRMAGLSPDAFAHAALRGATDFYGRPPNFANPELIEQTPPKYRDSLRVSSQELARQHAREVDLSKILRRLYDAYLARLAERGCLTSIDALLQASELLERRGDIRSVWTTRLPFAFVDDAQDLAQCDVRFLRALYGEGLAGVSLAGDPEQRTLAFAGPRADGILDETPQRFVLQTQQRSVGAIVEAARAVLRGARASPSSRPVVIGRFPTMAAEAAYVAEAAARCIEDGVPAGDIAVIARNLRCADPYLSALIGRDVPVDPCGEGSLYEFIDVEDALGALWSVADPFRHDWLLRNLESPWLALSDNSIATLCEEPVDVQTPLFEVQSDTSEQRGRRWDRQRDFRLAWNVLRGDRDADLTSEARDRLQAFRRTRSVWLEQERGLPVGQLARRIVEDSVLADCSSNARDRLRRALAERLLADIDAFVTTRPRATLRDYLLHAEHVAASNADLLRIAPFDAGAVALLDVEAAKGREFSQVFVVDVRAGAFPRYYVPDAFQFSPRYGMIPKENVGEAATATRTAKFTYFQYKLYVRTRYYTEERRALYCAVTRARDRVSITASGRATRGAGAPEFLEELRALGDNDDFLR